MKIHLSKGVNSEWFEEQYKLVLSFLRDDDTRPAREQFNERYAHGGGWRPSETFKKFKVTENQWMYYPGDPPIKPIAVIRLHEERIFIYEHDIIRIVQPDGSHEICRMD